MDKKPYSNNISHLPISKQEEHVQALSSALNDLIRKAKHNQVTQEKYFELELYFLQSTSLLTLFDRLLKELSSKLDLEVVELQLVDPNNEIQLIVNDIYGELEYKNLQYIDHPCSLEILYDNNLNIHLSQSTELIKKLFKFSRGKVYSVAMLPLVRENQLIGSIHLGSHNKQRFAPGLDTYFLQHLGSIIGICVENAFNQEQFKLLSLVDLLTKTKNRRYFIQSLTKEVARASRSKTPISCLFLDLDHFKRVNDKHGHLTGDRALQSVANCIMPLLRTSDVLARFGGEEFTIMLPDTNEAQALEIAERIRIKISEISIKDDRAQSFTVSVSIGASTWQPDQNKPLTFEQAQNYLISKADQGVYLAKERGRNCVQVVR